MKVLHITSEVAFVDRHIEKYADAPFQNEFIFLNPEPKYQGANNDIVSYWNTSTENLEKLSEKIKDYDGVILYYLDKYKCQLLDHINDYSGKIFWSFYGAEIYGLNEFQDTFYAPKTKKYKRTNSIEARQTHLKVLLQPLVWKLKRREAPIDKIKRAFKKINGLIWFNKFEYDQLNTMLEGTLPPYIESSVSNRVNFSTQLKDSKKIVIGNSGSFFNNHFEALDILSQTQHQYTLSMPINYGASQLYIDDLRKYASSKRLHVDFLVHHMKYEDYIQYINGHSTAVYYSYRQLGIGNIVLAIQCNLKIYLSEKNPTYHWLKSIGILVFSVEKELLHDLNNDSIVLNQEQIIHNQNVYNSFSSHQNNDIYFHTLQKLMVE